MQYEVILSRLLQITKNDIYNHCIALEYNSSLSTLHNCTRITQITTKKITDFVIPRRNYYFSLAKVILSFRDYSTKLTGTNRFIPVKSDDNRIFTCILDYDKEFVNVTDLLHEKVNDVWIQKVSTYKKVGLFTNEIVGYLESNGMTIKFNKPINRLTTIIAVKE